MCHKSCIDFGKKVLKEEYIKGRPVIEVGSMDVNGSLRPIVESFKPSDYIGVDIQAGPGVDRICSAENLVRKFGHNKFSMLICTEVLEHVRNWQKVIHELKQVVKPGGVLLVTTRSRGFERHDYPFDFWRYEISDIERLFSDFDIKILEHDSEAPGVFLLAMKPQGFIEDRIGKYKLYSMLLNKRSSIRIAIIYWLVQRCKEILKINRIGHYIKHPPEIPGMIRRISRRIWKLLRPLRTDYRIWEKMNLYQYLLYHQKNIVFEKCYWMGIRAIKNPFDAWIYQEIIHETRPEVIIEIGSAEGGSTLYFANLLDLIGHGQIISIDINRENFNVKHPRIIEITGDSSSPEVVNKVSELCKGRKVMIVHDGGHSKNQVLKDLWAYSGLVSINNYFIIEDGIIDLFKPGDSIGMPEDGPLVAVEEFLKKNHNFVVDKKRERYILTYNPKGFLKKI